LTPEERTGYTFNGWSGLPATMPAENITVTGSYTINQYKITYYVDGLYYGEQTYNFNADITALDAPIMTGYTFSGWEGVPTKMPAEDKTVNGYFTVNQYTITFKAEGCEDIVITQNFGTAITAPAVPVKPGFIGAWDTEVPATMPAQNMTINAVYTLIPVESHDAIFMVNGGVYATVTTQEGAQINAPADPYLDGYRFTGWSPEVGLMGDSNVTFVAQFIRTNVIRGEFVSPDLGAEIGRFENGNYYGAKLSMYVKVTGHPQKIQFCFMDNSNRTLTYDRDLNKQIEIYTFNEGTENQYEIWVIKIKLPTGDYIVRAKYGKAFEAREDSYLMHVNVENRVYDTTVYSFSIDSTIYSTHSTITFRIVTSTDIDKIQFVNVSNGATLTFATSYASYEDVLQEDGRMRRVWTIVRNTYGTEMSITYRLRAKVNGQPTWNEDGGTVEFSIVKVG